MSPFSQLPPRPSKSSQWPKASKTTFRGQLIMLQILNSKMSAHSHSCRLNHRHSHSRDQSLKRHNSHSQGILLQASLFGQCHHIQDYKGGVLHTILTAFITHLIGDRTIQHHMVHQLCECQPIQPLEAIH